MVTTVPGPPASTSQVRTMAVYYATDVLYFLSIFSPISQTTVIPENFGEFYIDTQAVG